jgi:hypothetical protein
LLLRALKTVANFLAAEDGGCVVEILLQQPLLFYHPDCAQPSFELLYMTLQKLFGLLNDLLF